MLSLFEASTGGFMSYLRTGSFMDFHSIFQQYDKEKTPFDFETYHRNLFQPTHVLPQRGRGRSKSHIRTGQESHYGPIMNKDRNGHEDIIGLQVRFVLFLIYVCQLVKDGRLFSMQDPLPQNNDIAR